MCNSDVSGFYEQFCANLLLQYGEIEEMNVCDNLGDHLVGNVYIKVCFIITQLDG